MQAEHLIPSEIHGNLVLRSHSAVDHPVNTKTTNIHLQIPKAIPMWGNRQATLRLGARLALKVGELSSSSLPWARMSCALVLATTGVAGRPGPSPMLRTTPSFCTSHSYHRGWVWIIHVSGFTSNTTGFPFKAEIELHQIRSWFDFQTGLILLSLWLFR